MIVLNTSFAFGQKKIFLRKEIFMFDVESKIGSIFFEHFKYNQYKLLPLKILFATICEFNCINIR